MTTDKNFCTSCDYCDSCNYCNYCDYCDYCNSCDSCDSCDSCKKCENLVNGFMCINLKFQKKDSEKYWIFNKEVTKEEWNNRYNLGKENLKNDN
jgi:hypothetical protein